MPNPSSAARLVARSITALLGGYCAAAALATAAACVLAHALPALRVEATGWAMILSFAIHPCLALWAFHEQKLTRVLPFTWGLAAVGTLGVVAMGPVA